MGRNDLTILRFWLLLCLFSLAPVAGLAQADPPTPKPKAQVKTKVERPIAEQAPPAFPVPPGHPRGERVTSEKSISVDPNISIKLCVSEGSLKINGWERNEVRVFVKNGRKIGFKVLEKDAASGKPNWLWVASAASTGNQTVPTSECLAGESIEIDVPVKAGLNLTGRATETTIDSVRKVAVKNVEGDITLRNITGGISAATYQGDVMVENSAGSITLESSTGNIVAFDVSPGQIGDLFKAKTNSGAVSMQKVDHRQIEANSISGSVLFDGKFLAGGIYGFKTSNGSIRMLLPGDSSFKFIASYGFGSLDSALPWKVDFQTVSQGGKNLVATVGSGDSTVNVTTSSGSIGIRKQK